MHKCQQLFNFFLQVKNHKGVGLHLNLYCVALNCFVLVCDLKSGKYARKMSHLIQQRVARLSGSILFSLNTSEISWIILTFICKICLGLLLISHSMKDYKGGVVMLMCRGVLNILSTKFFQLIYSSAGHWITTK